jgi:hypothetical protein
MRLGSIDITRRAVSNGDALMLRAGFEQSEQPQRSWVAVAALVISTDGPGWPARQASMSWAEYGRQSLVILTSLTGATEEEIIWTAYRAIEALPSPCVQEARVSEIRDFFGLPPISSLGSDSAPATVEGAR